MYYPFGSSAVGVDIGLGDAEGLQYLVYFLSKGNSCISPGRGSCVKLDSSTGGAEGGKEQKLSWCYHFVDYSKDVVTGDTVWGGSCGFDDNLPV